MFSFFKSCMLFDMDGRQVPHKTVAGVGDVFKKILKEVGFSLYLLNQVLLLVRFL